jgi:protein-disulfide isomerase
VKGVTHTLTGIRRNGMQSIFGREKNVRGCRLYTVAALVGVVSVLSFSSGDLGITRAQAVETAPRRAKVVAEVDGKPITEEALMAKIRGQLVRLEAQIYDVKQRGLDAMIRELLLENAAAEKGLTTVELLEQEVDSKLAEPTQLEIEAFYQGQKDKLNQPLEEVKGRIIQALKQAKETEATRAYLQALQAKAKVAVYLQPPRAEVSLDGAPVKGVKEAPVTIVEFSDFQCPFCKKSKSVTKQVLQQYSGKVKLAFRDFPIRNIHPLAQKAAEAARCAGEQGKYWEYHDLLFGKAPDLEVFQLKQYAAALGLDSARFHECLQGGKYAALVEKDLQDGIQLGVSSTPTFFVNGRPVIGAQPFSAFEKIIEEELQNRSAVSKGKR